VELLLRCPPRCHCCFLVSAAGWSCFPLPPPPPPNPPRPRFGLAPSATAGVAWLSMMPPPTGSLGSGCPNAQPISCILSDTSLASYSTISITCTVPPGAGVDWKLSLRGFWVSLGSSVGYAAPALLSITPALLPNAGGEITITGTNFGLSPCAYAGPSRVDVTVTLVPTSPSLLTFNATSGVWGPQGAMGTAAVPCIVTTWAPEAIVCTAPPGLDPNSTVRLTVGGHSVVTSGRLRYAAPTVVDVSPGGAVDTVGGALLAINGSGFPDASWPLAVQVGTRMCTVVPESRTPTSLSCVAPMGWGRQPVVVHTPLQASLQQVHLQYDAPEVWQVLSPEGRPITGGFTVEVVGKVRPCPVPHVRKGPGCLCCSVQHYKETVFSRYLVEPPLGGWALVLVWHVSDE
jgi:hypothetical protein